MRIAVLGAGIQGVCAALALANRGASVHLFDKELQPVLAASLWNEGKLHLGYTYANDFAERTAGHLLSGAFSFESLLGRYIDIEKILDSQSTPFTYVVHRESVVAPESIAAHFAQVDRLLGSVSRSGSYFGQSELAGSSRMSKKELESSYDRDSVLAAFRTCERSLDPHVVARLLRDAVYSSSQITFFSGHYIDRVVRKERNTFSLVTDSSSGEECFAGYDHVVNALWQDRLRIDAGLNLRPERPFLNRYKLAIHTELSPDDTQVPSTTIVLGPFGDVVQFGQGRCYLSWYPLCRVGYSDELQVPDWKAGLTLEAKLGVLKGSVSELSKIIPSLRAISFNEKATVEGGCIFAWGSGDVSDPDSELHSRFDIGVHTTENYHSIDTGKYSMAPLYGFEVANRIFGAETRRVFATVGRARVPEFGI